MVELKTSVEIKTELIEERAKYVSFIKEIIKEEFPKRFSINHIEKFICSNMIERKRRLT
jgi:hypothetical protein